MSDFTGNTYPVLQMVEWAVLFDKIQGTPKESA